ncbi:MAG: hypothetical protein ACQSGP_07515, partial [Frankia sp.]
MTVSSAADRSPSAAVDKVLAHRILRRRSAEITTESTLRSARASAALEGADLPMDDLRARLAATAPAAGLSGGDDASGPDAAGDGSDPTPSDPTPSDPTPWESVTAALAAGADGPDMALVTGAVRLHAGLGSLRTVWERAPRQALARMHVLAARGLVADAQLGRPRTAENDGSRAPGGGLAPDASVDDPLGLGPAPSLAETGVRLDGLADLLVAPTAAPAIVVAAVTHGEL